MFRLTRPRLALQLAAGSIAVHELRYRLGGEHGERSLADPGHTYLAVITPLLGLLLAIAAAHFLWAVWARRPETAAGGRIALWTLAPALLALHVGQEALEGLLAFGRPVDLVAVLANGGWIAAPLCVLVAAVIAWLTGGARRIARAVLARRGGRRRRTPRPTVGFAPVIAGRPSPPLADHGAERAPPLLAS